MPVVKPQPFVPFLKTLHQNRDGVQEFRTFGPEGDDEVAKKLRREANRLRDFVPVKRASATRNVFRDFSPGVRGQNLEPSSV